MALTNDEKNTILELRGKSYSYRRIAHETGHSETTVRSVIREAEKRVIELKAQGLEPNEIASQLDYPLIFVSSVIDRADTVQAEVIPVEAETRQPSRERDIKADLEEFRRQQALDTAKKKLHRHVEQLIDDLERDKSEYNSEQIIAVRWLERNNALEEQLTEFVLPRISEIHSEESRRAIGSIVDKSQRKLNSLFEDLQNKVKAARERRHRQERKLSDQLLDQLIDIPMYPQFVKEQIKDRFCVKSAEEASTVSDALTHLGFLIMNDTMRSPKNAAEHEENMWNHFMEVAKEKGWSCLQGWAAEWQSIVEREQVSINRCPRCQGKLTRKRVEDELIASCPSCGKSYQILEQ